MRTKHCSCPLGGDLRLACLDCGDFRGSYKHFYGLNVSSSHPAWQLLPFITGACVPERWWHPSGFPINHRSERTAPNYLTARKTLLSLSSNTSWSRVPHPPRGKVTASQQTVPKWQHRQGAPLSPFGSGNSVCLVSAELSPPPPPQSLKAMRQRPLSFMDQKAYGFECVCEREREMKWQAREM